MELRPARAAAHLGGPGADRRRVPALGRPPAARAAGGAAHAGAAGARAGRVGERARARAAARRRRADRGDRPARLQPGARARGPAAGAGPLRARLERAGDGAARLGAGHGAHADLRGARVRPAPARPHLGRAVGAGRGAHARRGARPSATPRSKATGAGATRSGARRWRSARAGSIWTSRPPASSSSATAAACSTSREFADAERLREVLRALDEKQRMLALLDKLISARGVQVAIGEELGDPGRRPLRGRRRAARPRAALRAGRDRPGSHALRSDHSDGAIRVRQACTFARLDTEYARER